MGVRWDVSRRFGKDDWPWMILLPGGGVLHAGYDAQVVADNLQLRDNTSINMSSGTFPLNADSSVVAWNRAGPGLEDLYVKRASTFTWIFTI